MQNENSFRNLSRQRIQLIFRAVDPFDLRLLCLRKILAFDQRAELKFGERLACFFGKGDADLAFFQ